MGGFFGWRVECLDLMGGGKEGKEKGRGRDRKGAAVLWGGGGHQRMEMSTRWRSFEQTS